MKNISPREPSSLSPYTRACLEALVKTNLAERISLGGALALFHYLDYRATHDVDAWWTEPLTETQKREVIKAIESTLSVFGNVHVRAWGDVVSVELVLAGKTVFTFQIASRSARLEDPISAGWIDVPLDSLSDLVASKMVALVERGAPRDFLDIYTLCQSKVTSMNECWELWRKRQLLANSDADAGRARLAIETHLERIAVHRPLDQIGDPGQREQAQRVREWYFNTFLAGGG